jgi:hypothetical protein
LPEGFAFYFALVAIPAFSGIRDISLGAIGSGWSKVVALEVLSVKPLRVKFDAEFEDLQSKKTG